MLSPYIFAFWLARFENLHNRKLDQETKELYYGSLKEFTDDEFTSLSLEIFQNEAFFPVAGTYAKYRQARIKNIAKSEWDLVLERIQRGDRYLADCGFHPSTEEAVRALGGLAAIGNAKESDLPFLFKEFCREIGYASGLVPMPRLSAGKELRDRYLEGFSSFQEIVKMLPPIGGKNENDL